MASRLSVFLLELKRRRVYPVAVAYCAIAAGIIGTASQGFPQLWQRFSLPAGILLLVGFPIALVLAWAYELRPDEHRDPGSTVSSDGERPRGLIRKSIIVLPFDNLSPDASDAYLAGGITEEIITTLSPIQSLRVISRNSAMVLKGTPKDIRTIAKELDVQFVLEGSVRKAGEDLRITAQLVDAVSDEHVWAERYDGVLDDVFLLQENVSRAIVESLKLTLTPKESEELSGRSEVSPQIYECYLRSREEFWKWSEGGLERALQIIRNGLEILGESELLYAALGTVYAQYIHFGINKDETLLRKAEECIEKVFSFNPRSSRGHYLSGFTRWWRGDPPGAVRHLWQALEIDPNDSDTLVWLGWIQAISGQEAAARPLFERALRIDPLNSSVYGHFSGLQWLEGKFGEAVGTWRRGFQMDPGNPWYRIWMAYVLVFDQRIEKAQEHLQSLIRDTPDNPWAQLGVVLTHALQRDRERAVEALNGDLAKAMERNELYPLLVAICLSMVDERREAINWVQEAVRSGCAHYLFLSQTNPHFQCLRGEESFERLLAEVKEKWEAGGSLPEPGQHGDNPDLVLLGQCMRRTNGKPEDSLAAGSR